MRYRWKRHICNIEKPCFSEVVTDVTDVTDSFIPWMITNLEGMKKNLRPLRDNIKNIIGAICNKPVPSAWNPRYFKGFRLLQMFPAICYNGQSSVTRRCHLRWFVVEYKWQAPVLFQGVWVACCVPVCVVADRDIFYFWGTSRYSVQELKLTFKKSPSSKYTVNFGFWFHFIMNDALKK